MNIYDERRVKIPVSKAKIRYLCEVKGIHIRDLAKMVRVSGEYLSACMSKGNLPAWVCDEVCRILLCTKGDLLD